MPSAQTLLLTQAAGTAPGERVHEGRDAAIVQLPALPAGARGGAAGRHVAEVRCGGRLEGPLWDAGHPASSADGSRVHDAELEDAPGAPRSQQAGARVQLQARGSLKGGVGGERAGWPCSSVGHVHPAGHGCGHGCQQRPASGAKVLLHAAELAARQRAGPCTARRWGARSTPWAPRLPPAPEAGPATPAQRPRPPRSCCPAPPLAGSAHSSRCTARGGRCAGRQGLLGHDGGVWVMERVGTDCSSAS